MAASTKTEYPTMKSCSPEAGGAILTREMMDRAIERMTDPAVREREAAYRQEQTEALNLHAKTIWAQHLGKTVDELTTEDMAGLNDAMFHAWLDYKGITEQDFLEFFGAD